MNVIIQPGLIKGKLKAPASKSSMQRACAAALLTPATSVIENVGDSKDEIAALNIIKKLGAEVNFLDHQLAIKSDEIIYHSIFPDKNVILDCGESGLSLRMFAPIAALFNYDISLIGHGSLLTRPVNFLEETLPQLNVAVSTNQGKIPVTLRGPLVTKPITVNGALSSQFLTGLLFAFAKDCKQAVQIKVEYLTSRPYIDLTLSVLNHFGFQVSQVNYELFTIKPRHPLPAHSIRYRVEGDWSNAAFLLVAAAIGGTLEIEDLDLSSTQGDKKIMQALYDCGANVFIDRKIIRVQKDQLKPFEFDATHTPDLFPPLVALAAYCNGISTIKGVSRLLHKESNRSLTLKEEFKKMNIGIELNGDIMKVHGGIVNGAKVVSHNDHRIAMACAVAAISAKGRTEITNALAVQKSYPGFFEDLKKVSNCVQKIEVKNKK
ncbi:MAG: 3-phosphoshikimate 1-carboxyvinyltransferase [Ginsengibacter sp.]